MRRLLSLLSLLPFCFASCLTGSPEEWIPAEVPLCSTTRLHEVVRMTMEQDGFLVLNQSFNPKTKTFTSGWETELHPFKGHGFRERAHVMYESGKNPGMMRLSVRVENEVNENLAKPLDPSYAMWSPAPDNPGRARVMLQYMRSLLGSELNMGKKARVKPEQERRCI